MITEIQIAAICNELTKLYPSHATSDYVWTAVYPVYYSDSAYRLDEFYWEQIFMFLLLVLAAEGVSYDC